MEQMFSAIYLVLFVLIFLGIVISNGWGIDIMIGAFLTAFIAPPFIIIIVFVLYSIVLKSFEGIL